MGKRLKFILMLLLGILFISVSSPSGEVIFEDYFTDGIKSEWVVIAGTWEHNFELDALEVNLCEACAGQKNKIKVDITTPDDVLVECKIIKLNTLENTYFDLLNRHIFVNGDHSGYSLAYIEVYARLYDYGLFLIRWDDNSRVGYLAYKTWAELGISGVADLEGKIIGIKCEGNVIKGYLDGVEILSATDDTYLSGRTGLLAQPSTEAFIFDDFVITTPGEKKKVVITISHWREVYD